eukprot:COSAG01_NODE_8132_length_2909_cov_4.906762_3_plen_451_part_00
MALALTACLVWQDLDETLEEVALDTELEVAQAAAAEPSSAAPGQAAADTAQAASSPPPGDPALAAHGRRLGVDLATEAYLLPVLREGYGGALPAGWAQGPASEAADGHVVYYNRRTGARTEEHPNDGRTRRRIEAYRRGRRQDQAMAGGTDGPAVREAFYSRGGLFPLSRGRFISTELYRCHACSCQAIEDGNVRCFPRQGPSEAEAAAAAGARLPAGWASRLSRSQGRVYYVHRPSGRRTWTHPAEEAAAAVVVAEPEAPRRLAGDQEQLSPAEPCVVRACPTLSAAPSGYMHPWWQAVVAGSGLSIRGGTAVVAGSGGRQWAVHPCIHMLSTYIASEYRRAGGSVGGAQVCLASAPLSADCDDAAGSRRPPPVITGALRAGQRLRALELRPNSRGEQVTAAACRHCLPQLPATTACHYYLPQLPPLLATTTCHNCHHCHHSLLPPLAR